MVVNNIPPLLSEGFLFYVIFIIMTDDEKYELDKRQRKEIHDKRESEIEKWVLDIEKLFNKWFGAILQKKYPFIKGIADVRDVGTHYPDKEHAIRIYLWASPEYTDRDLRGLDAELKSFIKMTPIFRRTLLDNEDWKMAVIFYIVNNAPSE